eukprot:3709654-Pleurochrysis_carterae.AAC.1
MHRQVQVAAIHVVSATTKPVGPRTNALVLICRHMRVRRLRKLIASARVRRAASRLWRVRAAWSEAERTPRRRDHARAAGEACCHLHPMLACS